MTSSPFEQLLQEHPTISVLRDSTGQFEMYEDIGPGRRLRVNVTISRDYPDQIQPDVFISAREQPEIPPYGDSPYSYFLVRPVDSDSADLRVHSTQGNITPDTALNTARIGLDLFDAAQGADPLTRSVCLPRVTDHLSPTLDQDLSQLGIRTDKNAGSEAQDAATIIKNILRRNIRI